MSVFFTTRITPLTDLWVFVIFTVTFALLAPGLHYAFGGVLRPFIKVIALFFAAYTVCVTWWANVVLAILQAYSRDRDAATSHWPNYGIYFCGALGIYVGVRLGYGLYVRFVDRPARRQRGAPRKGRR